MTNAIDYDNDGSPRKEPQEPRGPRGSKEPREPRDQAGGREFFTLGEHTTERYGYRFRYNGKVYRILSRLIIESANAEIEPEETLVLEESDSRKAYDAWNHIKRPERFSGKG